MKGHEGAVVALIVARDGRVFSGSWDHTIRGWDRTTGAQLMILRGHAGSVFRLQFAPDNRLFSASEDATIRSWDVSAATGGTLIRAYQGHNRLFTRPFISCCLVPLIGASKSKSQQTCLF